MLTKDGKVRFVSKWEQKCTNNLSIKLLWKILAIYFIVSKWGLKWNYLAYQQKSKVRKIDVSSRPSTKIDACYNSTCLIIFIILCDHIWYAILCIVRSLLYVF